MTEQQQQQPETPVVMVVPDLRFLCTRSIALRLFHSNIRWRRLVDVTRSLKDWLHETRLPVQLSSAIHAGLGDTFREVQRWGTFIYHFRSVKLEDFFNRETHKFHLNFRLLLQVKSIAICFPIETQNCLNFVFIAANISVSTITVSCGITVVLQSMTIKRQSALSISNVVIGRKCSFSSHAPMQWSIGW
jgi:hypothetical protein